MQSENGIWVNGVVLSFDLVVEDLKIYYSPAAPSEVYNVIRKYLLKNGFEHLKDSDYKNENIDDLETADLLYHFSVENKWFPFCVKKINISPNVIHLDVAKDIWAFRDIPWGEKMQVLRKKK